MRVASAAHLVGVEGAREPPGGDDPLAPSTAASVTLVALQVVEPRADPCLVGGEDGAADLVAADGEEDGDAFGRRPRQVKSDVPPSAA